MKGIENPLLLFEFPTEFYSDRLCIRMPQKDDGAKIYESIIASKDDFINWLPFANGELSVENSENNIREGISDFIARKDLRLLVFLKDTDTLIASSGLHRIDWSVPKFEIGYWIDSRYSGKGYMTEAVKRIVQFAFEDLQANRLEICCDSNNLKSKRIPERIGFDFEGELKNFRRHHLTNELVHKTIYGLSRQMYLEMKPRLFDIQL